MDTRDAAPVVMNHTSQVVYLDPDTSMWLEIAGNIAKRKGTCARRNVGAVLLSAGRVRELGWNGMERGQGALETCRGGACPRGKLSYEQQPIGVGYSNCIYLHAEANVLWNFRHSQRIVEREGWARVFAVVIYVSSVPCEDCQKMAKWAGADLVWEGQNNGRIREA